MAAPAIPDLAISPDDIKFTRFAFQGEPASAITFCDRTSNRGTAKTPRRGHNTMILVAPSGLGEVVARRDVPRLGGRFRPKRSGPLKFPSHYGCGRGADAPLDLPTGAYDVRICTDMRMKERLRANNCLRYRKAFVVAKRSWNAVITGSLTTVVLDQESWQANGAVLTLTGRDAAGRFKYALSAASVSYRYAQTVSTGCNRNGAGTDVAPTVELVLDYRAEGYYAIGRKSEAFNFAIPSLCENDTRSGPTQPIFLDAGIGAGQLQPMPFGSDQLAGTRPEVDGRMDWIFR